jgi:hypothetical protein
MTVDPRRAAEAARRIQDLSRSIQTHQSNIARIERDKGQQIQREQSEIDRLTRQIADLKRQL